MTYDWETHQKTCYRLYIEEGRPLEEIMEHMRTAYKFAPSKRAFQAQFRRWNFPPKQKPAYKDDQLVSRIKELWDKNATQREMLRALNEEGFDIKPRELMRVRSRYRWLMRVPNGERARVASDGPLEANEASTPQDSVVNLPMQPQEETSENVNSIDGQLGKKRRRRSRQSTDPNGSLSRFPSETSLDDARVTLGLDMALYKEIRAHFQRLCHEEGINKKSVAGPTRWEDIKKALTLNFPQLQQTMWETNKQSPNSKSKRLALDVLCTDVTKRMRNVETRLTLAEAKNVLGVNPEECRGMRSALQQLLQDSRFKCKSEASPEEWKELIQRWAERSGLVSSITTSENYPEKAPALETLVRDTMKRLRDDRSRVNTFGTESGLFHRTRSYDPQEQTTHAGGFDGSSHRGSMASSSFDAMSEVSHGSHMQYGQPSGSMVQLPMSLHSQSSSPADAHAPNAIPQPHRMISSLMSGGIQLDSPSILTPTSQTAFMDQQYVQPQYAAAPATTPVFQPVQLSSAYAIYLRLHPSSTFVTNTGLWIGTMSSQSIEDLHRAAVEKFPGALCARAEGIFKDDKGGEMPVQIEQDQELSAYLEHIQGSTPTFAVQLVHY